MGKKRKKNKKEKNKSETYNAFSRKELIDIHAEAYYKALKKIEAEKEATVVEESKPIKSNGMVIKRMLRVFIAPFSVKIGVSNENDITNSVFSFISSFVISVIGYCLWSGGIFCLICLLWYYFNNFNVEMLWKIGIIILGLVDAIVLGAMFIVAGKELDREKDGTKIMVYAANTLALVGVVIAIISLFIK